jgi:hypothetical protein
VSQYFYEPLAPKMTHELKTKRSGAVFGLFQPVLSRIFL